jgi:hypothetical protein
MTSQSNNPPGEEVLSVQGTGDGRGRLGEAMRQRRLELGLSVRAAAQLAELNRATWSSAERGTRTLRQHNQAGVEYALGWAPGHAAVLLSGTAQPDPATASPSEAGAETSTTIETSAVRPGPGLPGQHAATFRFDLQAEIERVSRFDLPADVRLRLIHEILDVYDQASGQSQRRHHQRTRI